MGRVTLGGSRPRVGRVLLMVAFLTLSFSMLWTLPGLMITREVTIGAMGLALPVLVARKILHKTAEFNSYEVYSLLLLGIIPAIGAVSAYWTFGQPVIFGLLAQRGLLLLGAVFLLSYLFERKLVSVSDVEAAVKILAWINLVSCAAVLLLLDPNDFSDLPTLVTDGGGVYNKFLLPTAFIIFGFFYYSVAWLRERKLVYGVQAAPFLLYIIVSGGRAAMVAVIAAYLITLARWVPAGKKAWSLAKSAALALAFVLLVQALMPDRMAELARKFSDAFSVTFAGEEVDDPSADARRLEAAIAWPYVVQNPLRGNGVISEQWRDGYKNIFGYFHPSDLGLLGVVYVYGLVGTALFAAQFLVGLRFRRRYRIRGVAVSHLYFASAAYILFTFFFSFASGTFAFWVEHTLLLICFMHACLRQSRVLVMPREQRLPDWPLTEASAHGVGLK